MLRCFFFFFFPQHWFRYLQQAPKLWRLPTHKLLLKILTWIHTMLSFTGIEVQHRHCNWSQNFFHSTSAMAGFAACESIIDYSIISPLLAIFSDSKLVLSVTVPAVFTCLWWYARQKGRPVFWRLLWCSHFRIPLADNSFSEFPVHQWRACSC